MNKAARRIAAEAVSKRKDFDVGLCGIETESASSLSSSKERILSPSFVSAERNTPRLRQSSIFRAVETSRAFQQPTTEASARCFNVDDASLLGIKRTCGDDGMRRDDRLAHEATQRQITDKGWKETRSNVTGVLCVCRHLGERENPDGSHDRVPYQVKAWRKN